MEYEMKSVCQKFTDMLCNNLLQNLCIESHVYTFEPLKIYSQTFLLKCTVFLFTLISVSLV